MRDRTIVEERTQNIAIMDVFSKLAQERIIFIDSVIDDELANGIIAQLLYLDSLDKSPINIYINSPGGSVIDGLAIYDVAKRIKSPIYTTCIGMAASMGAILMLIGEKRFGLPHSRIMLHEVSGHLIGKSKDVEVEFNLMKDLEKDLFNIVKEKTSIQDIDTFKVDKWYRASEAKEVGLLTEIL